MEQVMTTIHLSAIVPEMILTLFALAVLLIQSFSHARFKGYYGLVSLIGVLAAVAVVMTRPSGFDLRSVEYSFSNMWVVDNYARFFKLIFLVGTGLTILISIKYIENEAIQYGEYFALVLFATIGMMIMASGAELITIFLGLELLSMSLYVLAGYTRTRMISNESALKYFLLGSFASAFLLYGIALIYGSTGTTAIGAISKAIAASGLQGPTLVIGMALLVVGFGFKTALVPFHMWTPDVYEGAPAPITAFMSAGPKAAAFAAFARIFLEALPSLQGQWTVLIWIMAVLTMSVGNVIALVQDNIKRMLAYSSIAHAGYVLVAFLSAGELGITSILYYMLAYTFMNIGAFAIITVLAGKGEERVHIEDYRGIGFKYPFAAIAMSLFLFSLAGIPPTGGFIGKFYIFSAAVKEGYIGLAVIGVINSVVSVYYYLRVTVAMYMQDALVKADGDGAAALSFSPALVLAILISAYGVLSLGIFPSAYVGLVKQSFLVLQ
ncbi:MAG: NADH-quinone oxidoreductase subunit N [Thermodesulfobacteriota bacterium]